MLFMARAPALLWSPIVLLPNASMHKANATVQIRIDALSIGEVLRRTGTPVYVENAVEWVVF
jgi:hypothetical protein